MANTIQLKRRVSGVASAPAALKSGGLAHNEIDDTLYVSKGDDGSGNATSVVPMAGSGGFLALVGAQTVAGAKTLATVPKSAQDASGATDLVRKSQFDAGLGTKAALSHTHAIADAPEAVVEADEVLRLAYGNLVGLLVEAIKDLEREVAQLKRKLP